jgi:hypothetical protein
MKVKYTLTSSSSLLTDEGKLYLSEVSDKGGLAGIFRKIKNTCIQME